MKGNRVVEPRIALSQLSWTNWVAARLCVLPRPVGVHVKSLSHRNSPIEGGRLTGGWRHLAKVPAYLMCHLADVNTNYVAEG